ncbi:MIP/aquaporin family protein [Macrococcoides caseolyticum]|uniref:MIP/aquaporin family protein n=1 Tax=Macrococcoides caseolyticum TaxID=69966 RepID=UPI001F1E132B|nr:MIP/aquaporin family protein [Macrococcus caseolyticus]MCE4957201.1 aquaporin family protein [Macrococcus caseolyticus]
MNVYVAELVGTAILILFGAGVCANVNLKGSFARGADWIVIAVGWGLAVTLGVYAVGSISGAHLNPAVSIGLAVNGDFAWSKVPGFIIAQIAGAMIGASLVWLHFMPHFKAEENAATKLGIFATGPAFPNYFSNLLSEMIGTVILMMGLLFIGGNQFAEGLNPVIVGILIIAIGLSLGGATGYAINPARDFGPRLAHFLLPIPGKGTSNFKYAIVPILGPIAGGMLGASLYRLIYKGTFEFIDMISIVVFIIVLLLGVVLNKVILKEQHAKLL